MGCLQQRRMAGLLACVVLAIGALVYLLDRPPEFTPFFAPFSVSGLFPPVFGAVGQSLPTFAHVFSFSIFTALLLKDARRGVVAACCGWLVADAAFEAGQHPAIAAMLSAWLPSGGAFAELVQPIRNYFMSGTFDPWDLLSIALGAGAACGLLFWAIDQDRDDG